MQHTHKATGVLRSPTGGDSSRKRAAWRKEEEEEEVAARHGAHAEMELNKALDNQVGIDSVLPTAQVRFHQLLSRWSTRSQQALCPLNPFNFSHTGRRMDMEMQMEMEMWPRCQCQHRAPGVGTAKMA